jgi:membrane-associated phospholipid phosphatase
MRLTNKRCILCSLKNLHLQYVAGLIVLLLGNVCAPAWSAQYPPGRAQLVPSSETQSPPPVENLISLDYGRLVLDDTLHVLSAPVRWTKKDWLCAGLAGVGLLATAALLDRPLKDLLQKNRSTANDNFAKAIQPFGRGYAFGVLGAFEAGGLLFHNDNARATAHDGLISSIIAAGIITPLLKDIIGRRRPRDTSSQYHFDPFSGDLSLPSGHITEAFAVASVIAEHYDSLWIKAVSYGTAGLVGYARMELNAHWASDVLASALIGTVVGRTIVHFNRDRRYQLSIVSDNQMTGMLVTYRFF